MWDNEAIDLLRPAFIAFKGEEGEMRFIARTARLDVRYDARNGGPVAEFVLAEGERLGQPVPALGTLGGDD